MWIPNSRGCRPSGRASTPASGITPRPVGPGRQTLLSAIEGYYLVELISQLRRAGVLQSLADFKTPRSIATTLGGQPRRVAGVLEFMFRTSDLLDRHPDGRYRVAAKYRSFSQLGHVLHKFVGAYRPAVARLAAALRERADPVQATDRRELARAFAGTPVRLSEAFDQMLRDLGVRRILDLGCGTAALLVALCRAEPGLVAWGIDRDATMCKAARLRAREAGVGRRVRIIRGDVRTLGAVLRPLDRARIQLISGCSIINEFFGGGRAEAVKWLRMLRRVLPGRLFVAVDYYGLLNTTRVPAYPFCHTVLQDIAQLLAGQGVPPGDIDAWQAIYRRAGVRLVRAFEAGGDPSWFLHVVQL